MIRGAGSFNLLQDKIIIVSVLVQSVAVMLETLLAIVKMLARLDLLWIVAE